MLRFALLLVKLSLSVGTSVCPPLQTGTEFKGSYYSEVNQSTASACCNACTADAPTCAAWAFKASDVGKGTSCKLLATEPKTIEKRSSFVSGHPGTPTPGPPPLRLRINGTQIFDPSTGSPVHLQGFTWEIGPPGRDDKYIKQGEGAYMRSLLPNANLMRLIALKWDNKPQFPNSDCMTDTPPYFKDSCFTALDYSIRQATAAGVWVIITCRAQVAAGDKYDTDPQSDVFHNAELRSRMMTMWGHVAARYKAFDHIAGYEIMSEPRDKAVSASVVREFYAEGCRKVQAEDPTAPCIVGNAPYYKLWKWGDDIIIPDNKNVIYTFDYFVPEDYEMNKHPDMTYPGDYPCWVLYSPGPWANDTANCPDGPDAMMRFDKEWMRSTITKWAVPVQRKWQVPIYCNQWGIYHSISQSRGRLAYIQDLSSIFADLGIHWTYWIWRFTGSSWAGFELVHDWGNGNVTPDGAALAALNMGAKSLALPDGLLV